MGDGGVGKTSLIRARKSLEFQPDSNLTIGVDVDFIPFESKANPDEGMFLTVDLGGQERFHFIHDAYLRGIETALVVYDTSQYKTFVNLEKWIRFVHRNLPEIPIIVVGTKIDLLTPNQLEEFAQQYQMLKQDLAEIPIIKGHFLVSAKSGEGVRKLFEFCETSVFCEE